MDRDSCNARGIQPQLSSLRVKAVVNMGLMDKVKAKLSSSSDNKRSSVIGSSPAATSSTPATSSTTPAAAASTTSAAPATTTSAAATTTPAATATTTPAPATTGAGEPPYPPATTQDNKSTEPATSTSNMSSYTGTCHCKHHEWTVELTPDQSKHILWYASTITPRRIQTNRDE